MRVRVWGAAALRGVGELVLNVVTGLAALLLVAGLAVCAVLVPVGVRGPFERVRRVAGDLAGFQAERVLGAARRVSGRRELVWLVVHAVAGPASWWCCGRWWRRWIMCSCGCGRPRRACGTPSR
ncbi:hypothetical protein ACFMQL_34160 [Nonomuraea fastidiosa]|uniref:hypothetical protein n=1 Tax=Nonomuraea fastidiosa TaxID=46173 RepID=UPI00366DCCC0